MNSARAVDGRQPSAAATARYKETGMRAQTQSHGGAAAPGRTNSLFPTFRLLILESSGTGAGVTGGGCLWKWWNCVNLWEMKIDLW